jgi:EmrB/QacA subfamily drug resistance transporter
MTTKSSAAIGRSAALLAAILAVSMVMIDQTIVAICGPAIETGLQISHGSLEWGINCYLLATAATFALGGKIADHVGHKRIAMLGVAGFLVSSVLCAVTPTGGASGSWFIAARVLQGASGGLMFPAALGVVVAKVNPARRGRAMAMFFAITGAMTAIGPIAGGYLAAHDWRAIFLINVPIALASLVIFASTPVHSERHTGRLDVPGAILVALGMTLTILGLQQYSSWDHANAVAVGLAGVVVLLGAAARMMRATTPLVELRRFTDRGFLASALAATACSFAFLPLFFFLSVYGQAAQGISAQDSGLAMLKFFIGFVVGSRFGARIFDQAGAKRPIVLGGAIGAAGFIWWASTLTDLSIDGSAFSNSQLWPAIVAGLGIGLVLTPVSTDGLNRGDSASYGEITGTFQTMRNFGGALGLAVMSTVVSQQFDERVTTGFARLGAPRSAAECVVNSVAGGESCARSSGGTSSPDNAFTHVVQVSYAAAAQHAFWIMAGAMIVVAVVGVVLHPGDRRQLTDHVTKDTAPVAAQAEGRRVGALLRVVSGARRRAPRAARLDTVQR